MKAQIEFTLPDEQSEFEQASRAHEAFGVISDLDEALRRIVKYGEGSEIAGLDADAAEKVRAWLWEELQERGIAHLLS